MPIEVHCPNPQCAKVHLVKDKYAGMRGKCPACSCWMYIPKAAVPTMVVPRHEALEEAAWKLSEPATSPPATLPFHGDSRPARDAEETLPIVPRQPRVRPEAVIEEPRASDEQPVEVQPEVVKPKRHFSWLVALLLLVGMVSLGALAVTPFLDVGKINPTGVFVKEYGERQGERNDDLKMYVMAVPSGGAVLVFIALLAAFVGRQFGFLSLLLVYLTGLLSAALLFLALHAYRTQDQEWAKIVQRVERKKMAESLQGNVQPNVGDRLLVSVGGTVGASLSLLLAALLIHRRWSSRIVTFFILGGIMALVVVWIYRQELGIEWLDQYLPSIPVPKA
jgi:hypothetical protein